MKPWLAVTAWVISCLTWAMFCYVVKLPVPIAFIGGVYIGSVAVTWALVGSKVT